MTFEFEEAHREGARLVLGLGGLSGGGKTRTALELAWGLANFNSSKVGLICTENRRGRLYSDCLVDAQGKVHRFRILDLTPPFTPQRYIEAIAAAAKAGIEACVIDSVSHEWNGLGGCEDIANAPGANGIAPKTPRWNLAKREHKLFMNSMLQSPMHIIACLRAQEKVKLVKVNGKTEYEPLGVLPVQEKAFTFELTASMMLWNGGRSREILKCPSELESIFGTTGTWAEGYLTAQHGKMLRDWVDGGKPINLELQNHRDALSLVCEQGMQALSRAWSELPPQVRKDLGAECLAQLKASATAFDEQRKLAETPADDVNKLLQENN